MKMKLLACVAALAASMGMTYAQSAGTFGFGIELDGTGAAATNNGTVTLYALDNSGTTRLTPTSSSATLQQTEWPSSSTPANPTFNLGTFYTTAGSGNSLILDGGSMLTFKNGGANVSQADLFYTIYEVGSSPGTFNDVSLLFNQDNVAGNTGDQRWATEVGYGSYPQGGTGTFTGINLLAGLGAGTYILDVYGNAQTTVGTQYESNGGNNFAAEFTVVPEPSAWAMMVGGLVLLVGVQRIRRKSAA
jgi:hypothetical protein